MRRITVYEVLTERFDIEVPDDLLGDELEAHIEHRRVNGSDERLLVGISDIYWEDAE